MNRGLEEVGGAGVLVVSQFTLYGDAQKGRRPSFIARRAAGDRDPAVRAVRGAPDRARAPLRRAGRDRASSAR